MVHGSGFGSGQPHPRSVLLFGCVALWLPSLAACSPEPSGKAPIGSCSNGTRDQGETDIDCGGACGPCSAGRTCAADADCASGACLETVCQPDLAHCSDGVTNDDESDTDCGGACAPCEDGKTCESSDGCASGNCVGGTCGPWEGSCSNGVEDGDESDVDCGGSACVKCSAAKSCRDATDCRSAVCAGGVCQQTSCHDGLQNGEETDVDCGDGCPPCAAGQQCLLPTDCASSSCGSAQRCLESQCGDGTKNGQETDVDCGGATCASCPVGKTCAAPADCADSSCLNKVCQPASCQNGLQDGSESDLDCGGACPRCPAGKSCTAARDCASQVCSGGKCQAPTCSDQVKNGAETDLDCGGPACAGCGAQQPCLVHRDCGAALVCVSGRCKNGCVVSGTYYAPAARSPESACQTCQPQQRKTGFGNLADQTPCGYWAKCEGGECKSTEPVRSQKTAIGVSIAAATVDNPPHVVIKAVDDWAEETMGVSIPVPPPKYRYVPNPWPAGLALWSRWESAGKAPQGRLFPDTLLLKDLAARRITPLIYWTPGRIKLSEIASGAHDGYLRSWARAAKQWGKKVIVRWAHEQNLDGAAGTFPPWAPGKLGNTAKDYVAAWRRIVDVVRTQEGATNIKFFWCPNNHPRDNLKDTWPGERYVDYVGLDGYEWMDSNIQSMKDRFRESLNLLQSISATRPIILGETGIAAVAGTYQLRSTWLRDGYRDLVNGWARMKGIQYFDIDMQPVNGQPNWRLAGAVNLPDNPDIRKVFAKARHAYRGGY